MSFFQKLFGHKQTVSDAERQKAREECKSLSEANFILGQQLLNQKQYERAFQTFKLIAENDDHQDAQFNLAIMYQRGMGTEKNIHEAIRWYEAVAKHNDEQAMYNLGLIYHNGDTDLPKDNEKAFLWMQKAFLNGNEKAQAFLHEVAVASFEYIANDLNLAPQKIEGQSLYAVFIPTTDKYTEDNLLGAMRFEEEATFLCTLPFRYTEEVKNQMKPLLQQLNENTHIAKFRFNDENQLQSVAAVNLDGMIKEVADMHEFYDLLHDFTDIAAGETRRFYDILNQ